jgi:hypothetical protein
MTNDQSAASSVLMTSRLTARLVLVAAYSCGRRLGSSRDSTVRSASSCISKMRSRLKDRMATR